jgi:hypothetical protein
MSALSGPLYDKVSLQIETHHHVLKEHYAGSDRGPLSKSTLPEIASNCTLLAKPTAVPAGGDFEDLCTKNGLLSHQDEIMLVSNLQHILK